MRKLSIAFLLLFVTLSHPASGQNNSAAGENGSKPGKEISLFASDEMMDVSIEFDLADYLRKNLKDGSLKGIITFNPGTKDSLSGNVNIKTRGAFRLKTCSFAPMELGFKKSVNAYPDSGKIKKLKLVTHCQPGSKYDEYILREFLIYRLFNVLTDTSFRVRILKVTYIDSEKKRKPLVQNGFFIEPKSIMAARTNSAVVEAMNLTQNHIRTKSMDRVAIFSFMVGSWDWAVQSLHNIVVLKPMVYDGSELGIAVPFDFDLTGVVDPEYNMPLPETGLTSNRDRMYMGVCRDRETFRKGLDEFIAKKEKFYSVIREFPYLDDRVKKDISNYLDGFFDQLETQKGIDKVVDQFMARCKKI